MRLVDALRSDHTANAIGVSSKAFIPNWSSMSATGPRSAAIRDAIGGPSFRTCPSAARVGVENGTPR